MKRRPASNRSVKEPKLSRAQPWVGNPRQRTFFGHAWERCSTGLLNFAEVEV